jgi:cysteine-rich repeat protein
MSAAPTLRTFSISAALAALVAAASLPTACTAKAEATEEKICTPGGYVFCRCQDRQEGSKLCNEDGTAFGACEPCETWNNPEYPDGNYPPPAPRDAGFDPDAHPDPDPDAVCGDGVVQAGEDCDDGNKNETDGCNSDCKLAGATATASQACPGLDVHVWGGGHTPSLVSTTLGSGNRTATPNCTKDNSGSNFPTSGAAANDRVFKVTAHKSGQMTVTSSDANFNSFLYVSEACGAQNVAWFACINNANTTAGEQMTFPVDAGKTYYVFVDGAGIDNNQGTFRVTFAIP